MKVGNHIGLAYHHNRTFGMEHWLDGNVYASAASARTYVPGVLYHLVGTVSKTKGETHLYVNGELAGANSFTPGTKARADYATKNWEIGAAYSLGEQHLWPAKGVIRDVRLYRGVLSEAEVKKLNEGKN